MLSLNDRALAIVQTMIADAEALQLAMKRLDNGTTVVDAGVHIPGSLEAGRLFAEACLGGMGKVHFCELNFGEFSLPGVDVTVNQPALACMAAQYAGWAVKVEDPSSHKNFMAMGSGPAGLIPGRAPISEFGLSRPGRGCGIGTGEPQTSIGTGGRVGG